MNETGRLERDLDAVKLQLPFFGSSNPVWVSQVLASFPDDAELLHVAQDISRYAGYHSSPAVYEAIPPSLRKQVGAESASPVHHAFPVASHQNREGFVLPFAVDAAPDGVWSVSDAFGRMGKGRGAGSAADILRATLDLVSRVWRETFGAAIPIRWRRPMSFRMVAPIHLDTVDGSSLQLPVLLALLRGISASGIPERLPFGPHPVFCSGKMPVDGEDAFGAVAQVDVKAGAFLREYGSGVCHAILLPDQEHKLKAVIGQFAGVHVVSTVSELLKLPEIHEGLAELAKEPSLAEFDRFAHLATTEEAFRNFVDVESIATWLSRHADNRPYYRCYFLSQLALMKLHRGDFPAARQRLLEVEHAMSVHSEVFGVEDRLDFVARYADYAIDAWRPDEAMHKIAEIMPHAPLARPAVRAAFYGCACQVFRVAERFDEAIDSGESAVEAAKHGALGELHRDLNYLAHAYIARARSDCAPHCRDADLARAEALLNDSEGEYAPAASTARRIHFGFCRHLRAELARLRGLAFAPATPPDTYAIWDHPWLFTYGSAVSNRANGDARTVYARTLRNSVCAGIGANPDFGPILKLLGLIFSLHAAIALNESIGHSLRALDDALACDELEGWRAQLAPVLECIREDSGNAPACAAALLSKVPYF